MSDALDACIADIGQIEKIRSNVVLSAYIKHCKAILADMPETTDLVSEIEQLREAIRFDIDGLSLAGTSGIQGSRTARKHVEAARDRLIVISLEQKQRQLMISQLLRVAKVFILDHGLAEARTAKHTEDICSVALREIVSGAEDVDLVLELVKDTMSYVDAKSRALDTWFTLHKQYVFMTSFDRGPHGEQETYDKASQGTGRKLGRRRDFSIDDLDD